MDSSGIALESYAKGDPPFDINAIGIEFGVVIGQIKRAAVFFHQCGNFCRKICRLAGTCRLRLLGVLQQHRQEAHQATGLRRCLRRRAFLRVGDA